jgi:hypothetical protein
MRFFKSIALLFLFQTGLFGQSDVSHTCSHGKKWNGYPVFAEQYSQTDNQHDYDVFYYGLDLLLKPVSRQIEGSVEIGLMVIEDSIDRVELDLTDNYSVERIEYRETSLGFSHQDDLLTVELGESWKNGTEEKIRIHYRGKPESGSFRFDTRNGQPLIWSLSEPFGARTWWPCKDYPFDKADSAQIRITVPEGLLVGSNGTLISESSENGLTTFTWREQYPITTYLISVAVHPYRIARDYFHYGTGDSMEVIHYLFPDHFEQVAPEYEVTTEMLTFYSGIFGLYPFIEEKYGHAEFPWGGGMEHQTLTSIIAPYEYLIAHELAHQWWGNMITCKDFHHIWLNEGFATYAEALWAEHKSGPEAYHDNMAGNAYYGEGTIYVPDLSSDGRIFSGSLSYNKASWVLHMLRHVVGDAVFFQILRSYGDSSRKYGVATTEQFRAICEDVSGMDLESFFQQWIYEENHPVYGFEWSQVQQNGEYQVNLSIAQQQAWPVFRMPIDIYFEMANSDTLIVVNNTGSLEQYQFFLPEEVQNVVLDPDNWILKKVVAGRNLINHNNSNMLLSLADNGSIGFDAPNGNGNGLIYPIHGENLLYFGTPILAVGGNYLADNDIGTGKAAFARKEGTTLYLVNEAGKQEGKIVFDDLNHVFSRQLEIQQSSYSYANDPGLEDLVLLSYKIYNRGSEKLDELSFGILFDADIGYYLDNKIGRDLERQLLYQENGVYLGMKSLQYLVPTRLTGIRDALDNFAGANKFAYLQGVSDDFQDGLKEDWAMLLSYGPFSLEAGESISFPVALIGASDLVGLREKAEYMQVWYDLLSPTGFEKNADYSIRVVPNPAVDLMDIRFSAYPYSRVNMQLFDASGKRRVSRDFSVDRDHQEQVSLEKLEAGIYFIYIDNGNYADVLTVIKR